MATKIDGLTGTIIFSDTFDSENNGEGINNYGSFTKWDVVNGTVDLIGKGFFDPYPGNGLYVDLDGTSTNPALLESKTEFVLASGAYQLQFDLGGSQRDNTNQVTVEFGEIYRETFTISSDSPLTTFTRTIYTPSAISGKLSFQNDGGDNIGAILDNVVLASNTSSQGF
jgi:hypothetical protein